MTYGFLELLGVAGLGPGRNELRIQSVNPLRADIAIMLAAGAIGGYVVFSALKRLDRRLAVPALIASGLPVLLLAAIGYALHWRVVGRHLSPVLLPITLAYAAEVSRFTQLSSTKRIAVFLLLAGLGISAASVRFSERHVKDDYANVARYLLPLLDQSKVAWWVADPRGAAYYGLLQRQQLEHKSAIAGDRLVFGDFSQDRALASAPRPDVIAYSKPDAFDKNGLVLRYIESSGMKRAADFPAFVIYVR